MKNEIILNTLRFILLLFLQVLLFDKINLFGYINPYVYILFIILFPLDGSKGWLIFLSFLLGLSIDMFNDSGGVHAAASAFAAYIRPLVLKYSFGISYEYNSVKIRKADPLERLIYVTAIVILHNLVLFTLEIFSFNHILLLIKSTLFSGIFTIIVILCTIVLLKRKTS